ncbi:MAG: SDR family NAD(P)-dependent oxidoreductase [Caulobacteraceae bacterium]|jgi:NAD(P)-dependent dehydrogenase (short-subunit alcohol dehydrogenase family)
MSGPFGAQSTTDDVLEGVDLTGKRILVTGASAGLGIETARALTAHGAKVVGAARDLEKARRVTAHIPGVELIELDLASLASVRNAADALNAAGEPFDVVIANAGVMACPKGVTADGFETQFGTNHLGHFVFVNRIAPLIRERLVNLSSAGHQFADVDLEDPNFETTPYVEFVAYGRSKTANILFAVEFDRRHRDRGVRATALHPGGIQTELGRHLTPDVIQQLVEARRRAGRPVDQAELTSFQWKTIPQGAATSVWAAVVADPGEVGGRYCEDCHVAAVTESSAGVTGGVRPYALDAERAKALWAKSEAMVGERF